MTRSLLPLLAVAFFVAVCARPSYADDAPPEEGMVQDPSDESPAVGAPDELATPDASTEEAPVDEAPAAEPDFVDEAEGEGLPMPLVAGLQVGAGCLAMGPIACVAGIANVVPVVGTLLYQVVLWGGLATVIGTVGDSLGKKRGTIALPGLVGFCTGSVCVAGPPVVYAVVVVGAAFVVYGTILTAALTSPDPSTLVDVFPVILGGLAGVIGGGAILLVPTVLCGELLTMSAITGTYWSTAEPKEVGEGMGFAFPGILTPNHSPTGADVEEMAY